MNLLIIPIIAMTLHRPVDRVNLIYTYAPIEKVFNCAIVEGESRFNPKALNKNIKNGIILSTDWGYYQLNDRHHPQFRDDIKAHVEYGSDFVTRLIMEAKGNYRKALRGYNAGHAYPDYIMAIFERIKSAIILDRRYR